MGGRIPVLLVVAGLLAACGGTPATATVALPPTQTRAADVAPIAPPPAPTATPAAPATAVPQLPPTGAAAPTNAPTPTGGAGGATSPLRTAPAPPAVTAATPVPQPGGPIPAGWQVYRGPREFPIVVAYPPDWMVDDSLFPDSYALFIYGPKGREEDEVVEIVGAPAPSGANIDVLRDDFFHRKSEFCEKKGIEYTEHRPVSGATFAILRAACDSSETLTFIQVASGLKGGDEWSIAMRTPYARRETLVREVFDPMLASLNVYAPIP